MSAATFSSSFSAPALVAREAGEGGRDALSRGQPVPIRGMAVIRHGGAAATGTAPLATAAAGALLLLLQVLQLSPGAQALQNGAANVPPMGE